MPHIGEIIVDPHFGRVDAQFRTYPFLFVTQLAWAQLSCNARLQGLDSVHLAETERIAFHWLEKRKERNQLDGEQARILCARRDLGVVYDSESQPVDLGPFVM